MKELCLSALILLGAACTLPAGLVLAPVDPTEGTDGALPPVTFKTIEAGQRFAVNFDAYGDIYGFGPSDLYAFNFDLTYDPSVLAVTGVQEQGYFANNGLGLYYQLAPGRITNIGDVVAGPGPGENLQCTFGYRSGDPLVAVSFVVVGSGTTEITIQQNGDLYYADSNGNLSTPLVGTEVVSVEPLLGSGAPPSTSAVPEPRSAATMALAGLAMLGFGVIRKHRRPASRIML